MVRGPKTRPVPKPKVMPEDGETLKAAINGKLHKGQTDLLSANPRKRGRALKRGILEEPGAKSKNDI